MSLKKLRDVIGWVLVRYQKAYGLLGSFLNAFNFAGIFTLLLQPYFNIPIYIFLPVLFVLGLGGLLLTGILVYDKGNFQTTMVEKDGNLNDYWHSKLPPLNQKSMLLSVRMYRAMLNNNPQELDEIEKIIKGGVLR